METRTPCGRSARLGPSFSRSRGSGFSGIDGRIASTLLLFFACNTVIVRSVSPLPAVFPLPISSARDLRSHGRSPGVGKASKTESAPGLLSGGGGETPSSLGEGVH
mmetsp:Transcript_6588/g.23699  ORF Transcript_6588/g.23699 Transcript_6588/m.23699 type:complete len:106 (+) Transcript_6588:2746-3063(+)